MLQVFGKQILAEICMAERHAPLLVLQEDGPWVVGLAGLVLWWEWAPREELDLAGPYKSTHILKVTKRKQNKIFNITDHQLLLGYPKELRRDLQLFVPACLSVLKKHVWWLLFSFTRQDFSVFWLWGQEFEECNLSDSFHASPGLCNQRIF